MIKTGNIKDIGGVKYDEFREDLPSPDYFRYHYFQKQGDSFESQKSFTEIKYQPQIIQKKINKLMVKKLNSILN